MEINFVYTKKRREFGHHFEYAFTGSKLLVNIPETPEHDRHWIERIRCTKEIQTRKHMSQHEVNTQRVLLVESGMSHTEGGWPQEIDPQDEEQTNQFRKKVEREPSFHASMKVAIERAEVACLLNNALDITESYFEDQEGSLKLASSGHPNVKLISMFRDPTETRRSARALAWSPSSGSQPSRRLAVAYASSELRSDARVVEGAGGATTSYIWDLDNPSVPEFSLISPSAQVTALRYSARDSHVLIGGLGNGLVSCWDTRTGHHPLMTSLIELSHRDPVYDIQWASARAETEFYSVSTDGCVMWWDVRKLAEPVKQVALQLRPEMAIGGYVRGVKNSRTVDVSALNLASTQTGAQTEFSQAATPFWVGGTCLNVNTPQGEPFFLVGMETGHIFRCSTATKNPLNFVQFVYLAHHGAVRALERSPFYVRYFLTVGDWTVKLWHDDSQSPLRLSSYSASLLTGVAWSPTRPGVFATSRFDGHIDVWDLFRDAVKPTFTTKVSEVPLTMCEFESSGRLVASGTSDGTTLICEVSDALQQMQPAERYEVQTLLARDLKREKNLTQRTKEMHTRQKKTSKTGVSQKIEDIVDKDLIQEVEEEFFSAIRGQRWVK
eukprot:gnl/Chilomastix_cuspidata/90.p1 GENE.gnl/Chilomastix_cuspidata/90~~gnl/Chilomastix_cuspidata/90.p1  ORF type:complete len:609 (+),score=278.88 gnl/Chilomastix_cuspidata/90:44-1870(+)